MKTVLFISSLLLCLAGAGCGGDSGDSADESSASLYCEHGGDIWLCNEQGSCIRDESVEEVVVEEESEEGPVARRAVKLEGNITIIAECGSSVSFENEEEVNTVNVTTEVTGNLGVNE